MKNLKLSALALTLALAASAPALSLPPPGEVVAPKILLGTQIHYPSKILAATPELQAALDAEWEIARLATMEAGLAFPGGYLRYAALGHEAWWLWYAKAPESLERERRILTYLKRAGMRPFRGDALLPWPGSSWAPGWSGAWVWGEIREGWLPQLRLAAKTDAADYVRLLRATGHKESEAVRQDGNEPAAGHPGGNARRAASHKGEWDPLNLRRMREADEAGGGGRTINLAASLSMLDQPVGGRELATWLADGGAWTEDKDGRAMHFRFYRPGAGSPALYAREYALELARQAARVNAVPWPKGSASVEAERAKGVWVPEAYVASGDCPEPRAESWRLVLEEVRKGVPGVRYFGAYRFHPAGGPGGLDWMIPRAAFPVLAAR